MSVTPARLRIWRWLPLAVALLALPPILIGSSRIQSDTTDVVQWLPSDSPARQTYEQFTRDFGGDDFLIVSWPGCTLDDARLPKLAAILQASSADSAPNRQFFREITTGPQELKALTSPPIHLDREAALKRLAGILVGAGRQTTCLIAEMSDAGRLQQHAVIDLVYSSAAQAGVAPNDLRLGGSVYEAVIVDRSSESSFDKFLLPSGLISLFLTWWCLRSVRLTLIVLFAAVYGHLLSMAVLYYAHGNLNAVLVVMPTLIYVLTISGGIHLTNYYRDALHAGQENVRAAFSAFKSGWFPCTLASVTTAIGLGSLGVSHIAPVRAFGIYSALATIAALAIQLFLIPSLFAVWPARSIAAPRDAAAVPPTRRGRIVDWTINRSTRLTLSSLGILLLFGLGLPKLTATVRFEEMFSPDNEIIRNYRWLEEEIGPTVPVEIVLRIPADSRLTMIQRLETLNAIQARLEQRLKIGGVLAATTFAAEIPPLGSGGSIVARRVMERNLQGRLDDFIDNGFLAIVDGDQHWRMTVRASALNEGDYGAFVESVHSTAAETLASLPETAAAGIQITCTGLAPVIHEAQLQLFDDLMKSFATAFLLIYPIMALLVRSLGAGLVAMIPNVLPAVTVFGGLGWLGDGVDIGSVLCASVALGIAVDDTVHFLTWYRFGARSGLTRTRAVRDAFLGCSTAMFQTTLVCSFGMLVFRLSDFVPAQKFASLMFLLLWLSLLADLILMPALITGPFRIFFSAQRELAQPPEASPPLDDAPEKLSASR